MRDKPRDPVIEAFIQHIQDHTFPCLAAHSALSYDQLRYYVADHIACPHDDAGILSFLYDFVDELRQGIHSYFSAVVLFREPVIHSEEMFETFFWKRLQSLADMDALKYPYDPRVDRDVDSPTFSFSLKEEAFYIIGLHPASSRKARSFSYPAMVFNAHVQFEKLREENHYTKMQEVVRKRDIAFSGSVNPLLSDFGTASEAVQYTGREYGPQWKCPLIIRHARPDHHSAT